MFREFVIILCAGTYASGIAVHSGTKNGPAKSQGLTSEAEQQDHHALPSQNSYQTIAAPVSKYLPNSARSYQVSPAVVDSISEVNIGKSVSAQSYGSPNEQQPSVSISASVAADPSSSEYSNILERYAPAVEPIRPYFAAPVAAQSLSIGSQETTNAGQAGQTDNGYITRPFVVYTNNAAQSGQYYAAPSAQTLVESQRSANVPSPSVQVTQYVAPTVTPSAPRPFYPPSTAVLESHGEFTAQSPAVASYQVNKVQTVNPPPLLQYVPAPKLTYKVKPALQVQTVSVPVAPKKVTVEAYNSVQTHPPPAPKFVPAAIPVPVIYQQVENQPDFQQFALVSKTVVPTAASFAQVPVGVQPIPVPVYTNNAARLQYQSIPVNGGHQHGYAKAVLFSPASEVSRVIFNGLGVSYGW